jgi:hypothetical protein
MGKKALKARGDPLPRLSKDMRWLMRPEAFPRFLLSHLSLDISKRRLSRLSRLLLPERARKRSPA